MKQLRQIFKHKNNQITSAGITPYIFEDDCIYLLLIKKNDIYEDFGGKTEFIDNSIYDTAAREAEEESNGIFSRDVIDNLLPNAPYFYNRQKYISYFIKLNEKYDISLFGDIEIHDQIKRVVEWVKISDISWKNIHHRLRNKIYFNHIKKLN